jgi:basic membrane protein A
MEPTLKVAQDYPNVKFESITGYKTAPNVATANARYYEGRYLAGIAAGRMSKTGVAGYVAGFPIPEVLQGINAFALGMRSVNPQARSRWCGSTPGSIRPKSATPPWRCSTRTWT